MKNIIIKIALVIMPSTFYAQFVGINTTSPTRELDINGNLRVTKTSDKTNNLPHKYLVAQDRNTGNIDYITFPALDQNDAKNVEISKNIYISNSPIDSKTCSCGELTFYIKNSDNKPYIKLASPVIFSYLSENEPTPVNSFTLGYGVKGWSGTTYEYRNLTNKTFNTANFGTFQEMDSSPFAIANTATVRIYSIVLPKQNNLYRITLSRVQNSALLHQYGLMCEKFYIQEI